MSNKIIKISDSQSSQTKQLEVYRDISMVSERRIVAQRELVKYGNNYHMRKKQVPMYFASKDVNVKAVFNSIINIFTWIRGERILNPDFGSKLQLMLYEGITPENKEAIAAEIRGVVLKYEPRVNIIKVTPIDSVDDQEDNTVRVDIKFSIPSLSEEQYNYSYIYNRTE